MYAVQMSYFVANATKEDDYTEESANPLQKTAHRTVVSVRGTCRPDGSGCAQSLLLAFEGAVLGMDLSGAEVYPRSAQEPPRCTAQKNVRLQFLE